MIFILLLLIVALLGAPLYAVLAAGAMLGFHSEGINLAVMAIEIYRLAVTGNSSVYLCRLYLG